MLIFIFPEREDFQIAFMTTGTTRELRHRDEVKTRMSDVKAIYSLYPEETEWTRGGLIPATGTI